jgi:ribulose-phosphate 3-epimerase
MMPVICPSILAATEEKYREQMERVAHFAHRIQIDITDGKFAEPRTVSADKVWWPAGVKADIHIMHQDPEHAARTIAAHKPHMLIVHAESDGSFEAFSQFCHQHHIKVGVALLQKTPAESILPALHLVDHVLIFAGNLGHYGGHADMRQISKIQTLKSHNRNLEIGWDGGINDQNISQLAFAGVDVFNVGGFIQKADNPEKAFVALERIADETGET